MYLLLADGIMEERKVTARVLAPRKKYEKRGWRWNSPYSIAGLDMPDTSPQEDCCKFLRRPAKSEIFARAIERGALKIVEGYLRSGVNPNVYSLTGGFMLHVAVTARQPSMISLLLEYDADPSCLHFNYSHEPHTWTHALGPEPFFYAFTYDGDLMVRAFASSGKVDGFANLVVRYCSYETIQACVAAGMDLNQPSSEGETVAHALAKRNDLVMFWDMSPYLTSGTMTRVSRKHQTPLHVALKQPIPTVAMELIAAGAYTNSLDKSIDTTLSIVLAIENGHSEAARLLLERNTDLPLEKYIGSELLTAISACTVDVVRLLIHRGVSKEQDGNDYTSPLICAVRTGSLEMVKLIYEEGPKHPSLRYNPGRLFSPSAYATALALGKPEIADFLEGCIERDSSDPRMPCIPENASHANMAREIMETMSDLHHWDECMFHDEVQPNEVQSRAHLVNQIALYILPLAGADFDSGRIRDLVQKAQHICPSKQVSYHSMYALEEAIKDLELPGEEAGEGECDDPDKAGLLCKALPRLVSVIRQEAVTERRTLFLQTLEEVFIDHITVQAKSQMCADSELIGALLLPPGMNDRARQLKETLRRLCGVARENIYNDEIDRLLMVFLRLLRC
jgi:ankyrin repeat protein